MSIRRTFLMLVAPLFLLLAGVNGALLYLWEQSEAAGGLSGQAVAAAVTTAAFAGDGDLAAALADPRRAAALKAATVNVPGLAGLYVGRGDAAPVRIAGPGVAQPPGRYDPPPAPRSLPLDLTGKAPLAGAVAPAGRDGYVVAYIDARPLAAQVQALRSLVVQLVAAAGVLGVLLAWTVAGRIRREVRRNTDAVAELRAGGEAPALEDLTLRETTDLAEAVRLMKTGVDGRLERAGRELAMRDGRRDEASSAAAVHAQSFPPRLQRSAGMDVAVRLPGASDPGAFYALTPGEAGCAVVLGVCGGPTPADRLANALAARDFFERAPVEADRIEAGRRAFAVERLAWRPAGPGRSVLVLGAPREADVAQAYLDRAVGMMAEAVADDLAVLTSAASALAVTAPTLGKR